MGLPTSTDTQSMDWSFGGQPFVNIPSNNTVVTTTMDWSYGGLPFVTNPALNGPTNVGGWDGVNASNIQALYNVQYVNVETIMGVT